jgi:hypothetical protein
VIGNVNADASQSGTTRPYEAIIDAARKSKAMERHGEHAGCFIKRAHSDIGEGRAPSCDVMRLRFRRPASLAQGPVVGYLVNASVNKGYLNAPIPALVHIHYHTLYIRTTLHLPLQIANQSITFESILQSIDYSIV